MLTFLVFIFYIRQQFYDLVVHEITLMHFEQILPCFVLQDLYNFGVVRVATYHLGWPVRRPRQDTILTRTELPCECSQAEFMQLFAPAVAIDPHVLWAAPEAEIAEKFRDQSVANNVVPKGSQHCEFVYV